jgi:hypothetical protein
MSIFSTLMRKLWTKQRYGRPILHQGKGCPVPKHTYVRATMLDGRVLEGRADVMIGWTYPYYAIVKFQILSENSD